MNQQTLKRQHTMAFGFSSARLALNYYMFEDGVLEEHSLPEVFMTNAECFRKLLEAYLGGQHPIEELKALRNTMIREVEIISGYIDCFQIYEYALNRQERRFCPDARPVEEDGITAELMEFIVEADNSRSVNGRIQQVIGQLPVRLTRQKFFSMVREALSIYNGANQSSLDHLMYRLKTSAMIALPESMDQRYEELHQILAQFGNLDYKTMDKELYGEYVTKIRYASDRLNLLTDWYVSQQQLINDLYVLMLTKADAVTDHQETRLTHQILSGLLEQTRQTDEISLSDDLIRMLMNLEGMQENYYEKYQQVEPVDKTVDLLLSGSDFVLLEPDASDEDTEQAVDPIYLDHVANQLFEALSQLFGKHQKPVVRAVMAKILSELPVCFNQLNEIREYIENSFASCSDSKERETCIVLLRQMMENENALV